MIQLLANQKLHVLLPFQNDRNYSEYELRKHLPLIESVNAGTQYLAAMSILNT